MNEEKKSLFGKYREIIVYIIVGVMTTIYCWVFNWILTLFMDANIPAINFLIQTINWFAGVSFSYPLNRKWVFQSKDPNWIPEFAKFAGSRVSTGVLDVLIMLFFVNVCPFTSLATWAVGILAKMGIVMGVDTANYWFVKIFISSVVVMICNYVFSKLIVFSKKKDKQDA